MARSLPADARVMFRDGFRPVASTLPAVMTVFVSTPRVTTVLVDGRPVQIATAALARA